jgi:hypothetical protein
MSTVNLEYGKANFEMSKDGTELIEKAKAKVPAGVKFFSDYLPMLDEAKPQAVIVTTANNRHLEILRACAKRKIHFDTEKPMGFSRRYYLHYLSFNRFDTHFDSLSNLLCILSGVADAGTTRSILDFMRAKGISRPYPVKVLYPPYRTEGASFDTRFDASVPVQHRSPPYAYHNGAVWPFVGGFYVCTLNAVGDERAAAETKNLARSNSVRRLGETVGFNEWIHGRTGRALGQYGQSWNAGMYVAAVLSAKGKNPLGFLK